MSLWNCPVHGLYGGQVLCPSCGITGEHVSVVSVPWFEKAIRDYADAHGPSGGGWNISAILQCLWSAYRQLDTAVETDTTNSN